MSDELCNESLTIKFHQGGKDHLLEVDPTRPVSHLMDKIEEITEIPPTNMKGRLKIKNLKV